jgi:hypothetical protein
VRSTTQRVVCTLLRCVEENVPVPPAVAQDLDPMSLDFLLGLGLSSSGLGGVLVLVLVIFDGKARFFLFADALRALDGHAYSYSMVDYRSRTVVVSYCMYIHCRDLSRNTSPRSQLAGGADD